MKGLVLVQLTNALGEPTWINPKKLTSMAKIRGTTGTQTRVCLGQDTVFVTESVDEVIVLIRLSFGLEPVEEEVPNDGS